MATKKAQRWGIMIVMIALVIGTLGSFAVMILNQKQQAKLQAAYAKAEANFTKESDAYQAKVDAQSDKLSKQYYNSFKKYSSQVTKFSIDSVKKLTTKDLVVGTGKKIAGTTDFAAYYIGWDADGHIFDESIDTSAHKLKAPFSLNGGLDSASVIEGWKDGLKGMRIGGVRLLTIPSDQAYGEAGMTDSSTGQVTIAPNTPLKFVVMAIPMPKSIPQSEAYMQAYAAYASAYQAYMGTN